VNEGRSLDSNGRIRFVAGCDGVTVEEERERQLDLQQTEPHSETVARALKAKWKVLECRKA
jgi:hypothetical protein